MCSTIGQSHLHYNTMQVQWSGRPEQPESPRGVAKGSTSEVEGSRVYWEAGRVSQTEHRKLYQEVDESGWLGSGSGGTRQIDGKCGKVIYDTDDNLAMRRLSVEWPTGVTDGGSGQSEEAWPGTLLTGSSCDILLLLRDSVYICHIYQQEPHEWGLLSRAMSSTVKVKEKQAKHWGLSTGPL